MSDVGKDKGRVLKSWLVCIFAFFPIANCIPFFYMNNKTHRQKYAIFGWLALILNIVIPVAMLMTLLSDNPNQYPSYKDVETAPDVEDYMNDDQKTKYWEDISYDDSAEFKLSEEGKAYEAAVKEYEAREKEWLQQPEITAQLDTYNHWSLVHGLIIRTGLLFFFVMNFFFLVLAFIERPRSLQMQMQSENKTRLVDRLQQMQPLSQHQETRQDKQETDTAVGAMELLRETVPATAEKEAPAKVDINRASEEELASLPGLTIVDAKKAIAYRDRSGGFASVDDFFDCIQAKPHVIVRIQDRLMAGTVEKEKADSEKKPETKVKRRIEL